MGEGSHTNIMGQQTPDADWSTLRLPINFKVSKLLSTFLESEMDSSMNDKF